jgi:DnaJ domain
VDIYKILKIKNGASCKDIEDARKRLASKFHPYRNPGRITQWRLIERVYKILIIGRIYEILTEPRDPEDLFKKYLGFDQASFFNQESLGLNQQSFQKSFFDCIPLSMPLSIDKINAWKETVQGYFSKKTPLGCTLEEACERISECFSMNLVNESKVKKSWDCAAAFIFWVVMRDKSEFLLNQSFMSMFVNPVFDDVIFDEAMLDEVMRDKTTFDGTRFDETIFDQVDETISSFNKPYEDIRGEVRKESTIVIAMAFGSEKIILEGFRLGLFTACDLGVALSIAIIQDKFDLFGRIISVAKKDGILVSSIESTDFVCRNPLFVALHLKREYYAKTLIKHGINLTTRPLGMDYLTLANKYGMSSIASLIAEKMVRLGGNCTSSQSEQSRNSVFFNGITQLNAIHNHVNSLG